MVPAIVVGSQPAGLTRIAHNRVKVNHRVEVAGRANPLIDGLAVRFAKRAGMIIVRACIRGDSRTNYP